MEVPDWLTLSLRLFAQSERRRYPSLCLVDNGFSAARSRYLRNMRCLPFDFNLIQ